LKEFDSTRSWLPPELVAAMMREGTLGQPHSGLGWAAGGAGSLLVLALVGMLVALAALLRVHHAWQKLAGHLFISHFKPLPYPFQFCTCVP
jgi:hypothetical protein